MSAFVAALVVAAGWFITAYFNRRKDVAAVRLTYRLQMLESFLPVWSSIQENSSPFQDEKFLPLLEKARESFQLYGYQDEIESMEKFIKSIEQKELVLANCALNELVPLVRNRVREELRIIDK